VPFRSYRRNLPHVFPEHVPIFFTWRLYGSLPATSASPSADLSETHAERFLRVDRLLDTRATGPKWLKIPRVASAVAEEIELGASRFHRYELMEYVVMPNHVHLLILPFVEPAKLMRRLKGSTATRANQILERTREPFWQDESFDHWCRSVGEVLRVREYIAMNPVKCGLAAKPADWPWSSAHQTLLRKQRKLVQRDVCQP
jgi:type I restriction enzyme R subunit/putative DNA methylase